MPPLDGAFALAENLDIAVLIGQHLKLDVPRRFHKFLHVHVAAGERGRRFRLRLRKQAGRSAVLAHNAHAAPAASGRRFQHHRITDCFRRVSSASSGLASTPSEPGRIGTPCSSITARARCFRPIVRITSGLGPMNLMPRCLADFREIGVLAQESVARMNRVHVRDFRRADDGGNIQIAARAFGRSDADSFVGKTHVQAVAVGFGIDRHGLDAEFLARADDA